MERDDKYSCQSPYVPGTYWLGRDSWNSYVVYIRDVSETLFTCAFYNLSNGTLHRSLPYHHYIFFANISDEKPEDEGRWLELFEELEDEPENVQYIPRLDWSYN